MSKAILNSGKATNDPVFNLKAAALFHSTSVLDRRRRTQWDSGGGANRDSSKRYNHYAKRYRKLHSKQELLRNVSAFAEHLFQSWKNGFDDHDSYSSRNESWFRRESRAKNPRGGWTSTKGSRSAGRRAFDFCDEDSDVETMFRSSFGGTRFFYCSFVEDDFPRSGFSNNFRTSWKWRRLDEEEDYDTSSDAESSEPDVVSDRLALGLGASGPLKMDDVKNAYRVCAMKWHPDRHQGPSKAVAEEKFKACSAAYQSLCDKLSLAS